MFASDTARSIAAPALAGLLFGLLTFGVVLVSNNGDPLVMLALGQEAHEINAHVGEILERDLPIRPGLGHDGKFFFLQSLDPLYISSTEHAELMDGSVYRSRRVLYPLLTGVGGLAPPLAIPWLMGLVSAAAYAVGTGSLSWLARQRGHSEWLGLTFVVNVGLIEEFQIGGAGIVALAAACLGVALAASGREWAAGAAFAAAVLGREVMVLFVVGAVLYEIVRHRRLPWGQMVPGVVLVGSWYTYVTLRLGGSDLPDDDAPVLGRPFEGVIDAWSVWMDEPIQLATALVLIVVLFSVLLTAWRQPSPLGFGGAAFALLFPFLTSGVLSESFNSTRAMAPAFTVFAFLAASELVRSRAAPEPHVEATTPIASGTS